MERRSLCRQPLTATPPKPQPDPGRETDRSGVGMIGIRSVVAEPRNRPTPIREIEPIEVHHLGPGDDEVADELLAGMGAGIDLGVGARSGTIVPYFLPGLLDRFAAEQPEISVVVQEDTTDELVRRRNHGEIDLAILALPVIAKHLEVEPLFDEELLLVLPAGHPLERTKKLTAASVDAYPFVMLNEAHCLAENIAAFCRKQAIQPVTVERTSQITTVQELVALNHGVSVLPEMARRIDGSRRRVYRSFTGEVPVRTVAMMSNLHRYRSQSLLALMDCLRRGFRKRA